MSDSKLKYHLDLIVANLLYGANLSVYVYLVQQHIPFRTLFFFQVSFAALVFLPFVIFSPRFRISWSDFKRISVVSVLIIYGGLYLTIWGSSYTSSIDAGIITTLGPIFTIAAQFFIYKKPLSKTFFFGILLALLGIGFLLFSDSSLHLYKSKTFGNILILASVICIATNTVVVRPLLLKLGAVVVMGWYFLVGFVLTAPFFMKQALAFDFSSLGRTQIYDIVYVIVIGTMFPSLFLFKGTAQLTPVQTAIYRYLRPIMATAIALWRGQDKLTVQNVGIGAIVFVGLALVILAYRSLKKYTKI